MKQLAKLHCKHSQTMLALRVSPPPLPHFLSKPKLHPRLSLSILTINNPRKRFLVYAKNNGNADENGIDNEKSKNGTNNYNRIGLNLLNLVLDPDPENVVAVGLTGLLTWASVQVLWQLVVVSAAIVIAAVKYSVVAALLLFVLITLL